MLRIARLFQRWGFGPAAGYALQTVMRPDALAIVDERGALTFREVERRTNALARGLLALGVGPGSSVALMCRNHRGFVEASIALWKLGAVTVHVSTAFPPPQVEATVRQERVVLLVHDAEFGAHAAQVSWVTSLDEDRLEELACTGSGSPLRPPRRPGRAVILTSGTTGRPRGARRALPASPRPALSLLSRIPMRTGEPTLVAAPLFHAWGFAHLNLSLLLGSTLVLDRHFDPERALEAIERHGVTTLIAVPLMLQRMLEVRAPFRNAFDTASLRVAAVSGSVLLGELAPRFMDAFGDVLYNLYGSTEVAWAAVATPDELRRRPATAGRPPRGTTVRIYDDDGVQVPRGQVGHILVRNEMPFEGYTDGETRARHDGLMDTGDLGRIDEEGLLFVEGRDDDMIVTGGENVYPQEVEDLLASHAALREAAVVGVPDPEYGQALHAYVVRRSGHDISAEQVRNHVRRNLAGYKVPREVWFLAELPHTVTGKVLKRELTLPAP